MFRWAPNGVLWVVKKQKTKLILARFTPNP